MTWLRECFLREEVALLLLYDCDEPRLKHAKPAHLLSTAAEVLQPRMGPLHQPGLQCDMGLGQPNKH